MKQSKVWSSLESPPTMKNRGNRWGRGTEGMVCRDAHLAPAHLAPHAEIIANLLNGTSAARPDDEGALTTS